jgi:hypothetical protein
MLIYSFNGKWYLFGFAPKCCAEAKTLESALNAWLQFCGVQYAE